MNGHRDGRSDVVVDWPPPRRPRRRVGLFVLAILAAIVLGGGTALSYYVEALWFESLGFAAVFWKTLNLQASSSSASRSSRFWSSTAHFSRSSRRDSASSAASIINGQPLKLPVEPVLKLIAVGLSLAIAAATGAGMMAEWPTLALYWYAPKAAALMADPIFGRPLSFYLFTLPAWQLVSGWLLTLAVVLCAVAAFFVVVTGGARVLTRRREFDALSAHWRGLSIAFAALLLTLAGRVYLGTVRALVRGSHDLRRRHLHRCARHADRHARCRGRARGRRDRCRSSTPSRRRARWLVVAVVPALRLLRRVTGWSAGTSAASSSSRTSWCANARTSRTTSR